MPEPQSSAEMIPDKKSDESESSFGIMVPKNTMRPCDTLRPCDILPRKRLRKDEDEVEVEVEDEVPGIVIESGQHIDVVALLSSKDRDYLVSSKDGAAVPVSSLVGNYVIVCCFFVPFGDDDTLAYGTFQSFRYLFSHLHDQGIADQVKLVVIPLMPDSRFDNLHDFEIFLQSLSVNCLTIPFSDSKSRHCVCQTLDSKSVTDMDYGFGVPTIAVDPTGIVLQGDAGFLRLYGSQSFPFDRPSLANISQQDKVIPLRLRSSDDPLTVDQLLQCDNLSLISDHNKSIPTSALRDTPLGIYLYYDGGFMVELLDILQKCVDKGLKLEIVIVPLPFQSSDDPDTFYSHMKKTVLKDSRSSSWWAYPLNEKICRALWRVFPGYANEDHLIIMPHGDCLGELFGKYVVTHYGIDAYPFTKDAVVQRKVTHLRSLDLESLLGLTYMLDEELFNKNVILHVDNPSFLQDGGYLYRTLPKDFSEIEYEYPGTKVIFVSLVPGRNNKWLVHLNWSILPRKMCASVIKHIFMDHYEAGKGEPIQPTLVAFGTDGKILSRQAQDRLPSVTSRESIFDDTLHSEILADIEDLFAGRN